MVRITAARPVAQRHRARHATLAWVDAAAYSDVTKLRSSTSASAPRLCTTWRALSVKRQVLEISPGQVPSLRALPQMISTRDGTELSCQRFCAALRRLRVLSHCTEIGYVGSAKPRPAGRVMGALRPSWWASHAIASSRAIASRSASYAGS